MMIDFDLVFEDH